MPGPHSLSQTACMEEVFLPHCLSFSACFPLRLSLCLFSSASACRLVMAYQNIMLVLPSAKAAFQAAKADQRLAQIAAVKADPMVAQAGSVPPS